jgi:Histidine kinase-, DNA gyrase B-, and HSP90-like ATPase
VDDNGTGLPPGFSLGTTTSLGLQIVRTLVETELGGRLTITPRPGGGTRVMVVLPAKAVAPVPPAQPEPGATGAESDTPGGARIDAGQSDIGRAAAG